MRLSERAKRALLDAFVRGVPAGQCTGEHACADSRERFYRLVRGCCARYEELSRDGLAIVECVPTSPRQRTAMRGWSRVGRVVIIGIVQRPAGIQIAAPAGGAASALPLLRELTALGGIVQLDDTQAYACLRIEGEYVIVPRPTRGALVMHATEVFWHSARLHLHAFRKIPVKFFPLYLAEACLRLNRPGEDLGALLYTAMNATAIGELKLLLAGKTAALTDPTLARSAIGKAKMLERAGIERYRKIFEQNYQRLDVLLEELKRKPPGANE